jgi:hypothetical protein
MCHPSDQTHREQQQTHHNRITQTEKQKPNQASVDQSVLYRAEADDENIYIIAVSF